MLISWLWRKLRGEGRSQGRKQRRKSGRKHSRLRVEELEQRSVPSVYTWKGGNASAFGDQEWSYAANWLLGAATATTAPGTGDSLVFPAGNANYVTNDDLASTVTLASLTFQAAGFSVNNAMFGAPYVSLAGGGNITAAGCTTFNMAIQLAGASTFQNTVSGSNLTINGGVTANGLLSINGAGNTIFGGEVQEASGITISGAGNVTFSASPSINGAGGLTMSGTSTVTVNGNATVSGANITSGTLDLTGSITGATVTGTAKLFGNGTVNGPLVVTNGGTVKPSGMGIIGTLTATSVNLTGGALVLSIPSTSNYDKLVLTNPPTLGNATLNINATGLSGGIKASCRCAVERIWGGMQRDVCHPDHRQPEHLQPDQRLQSARSQ